MVIYYRATEMKSDCKFFSWDKKEHDWGRCCSEDKEKQREKDGLMPQDFILTCKGCPYFKKGASIAPIKESEKKKQKGSNSASLDGVYKEVKNAKGEILAKDIAIKLKTRKQTIFGRMRKLMDNGLVEKVRPGVFKAK